MKIWSPAVTLMILLLVQSCSTNAVGTIPPQIPDPDIEAKLRSILPTGWSLLTHDNSFTLARHEKVWLYVEACWDLADYRKSLEERVKKYGYEERYEIRLRFEPRLTDAEFQQLQFEREPYEKILNEGARSKDEWASGIREFYLHKVPVYFTDKYSVFAEKSNEHPVRMYPESALTECRQVLASLDSLFQRYREKTDRDSDF
jgi:hypothetical protein